MIIRVFNWRGAKFSTRYTDRQLMIKKDEPKASHTLRHYTQYEPIRIVATKISHKNPITDG